MSDAALLEKLWSRVTRTDSCWFWTGPVTPSGTGWIRDGSKPKKFSVHRLVYEEHFEEVPEGQCVMHRCGAPNCVNPEHLYVPPKRVVEHGARPGPKARPAEERFWVKVDKSDTSGCWEWTGNKNGSGYGLFMVRSPKKELAHRVSYRWDRGSLPPEKLVCHRCDNPGCVNPSHLFLGSARDNIIDMVEKGRGRHTSHPGESNGYSKLTEREVRSMRKLYESRNMTQVEIAKMFDVSRALVSVVVNGKAWKHVT